MNSNSQPLEIFLHLEMLEILRFLDLEQEACDQEQKESQESITSFLHEHMCVFSFVFFFDRYMTDG